MAIHSFGRFLLLSVVLLSGCATQVPVACVGDPEMLGYHDGTLGERRCANSARGTAAVAYESGWSEGIQRFCTEERGYQQGCLGAPMSKVCPDTLSASYVDGYQAGYAVYVTQLELAAIERSIETKSIELERIWSQLDAVAGDLEQTDADAPSHALWFDHSQALMARQAKLNAEIDALESEIAARKLELTQMRHEIAISY